METCTKVAELLGVEEVRFIEPSFSDLPDDSFTYMLLEIEGDQGRLLVDEESDPIALAVHTGAGWIAGSFHLRSPTGAIIEYFEDLGGDIYQEDRSTWESAVREYYSGIIARMVTPALEDLNPARTVQVRELLSEYRNDLAGTSCIDCCCGSGVGSLILREMGYSVFSYDNDPALLSLGLQSGRLLPAQTMHIDATRAGDYINGADCGLGLMFGEINEFNRELWEDITSELISLTARSIITVGTEREAGIIEEWARELDCSVVITENQRDMIYDRWVCRIRSNPDV
jgi:hypothetical protein